MLFDLLEIGDSLILAGDGCCHTFVKFRFIVFRPFKGEILIGKVRSCSQDGLRVSVDFFDDIFIPSGWWLKVRKEFQIGTCSRIPRPIPPYIGIRL